MDLGIKEMTAAAYPSVANQSITARLDAAVSKSTDGWMVTIGYQERNIDAVFIGWATANGLGDLLNRVQYGNQHRISDRTVQRRRIGTQSANASEAGID